jgi:hypothetical protein
VFREGNKSFYLNEKFALVFSLILIFAFFLISLLFLKADPDVFLGLYSRDAFTDEGLNTSQIANFVKFSEFDIYETNNFLKTPLFNLWMLLGYSILGVSIESGRLWILIGVLIMLIYLIIILPKHRLFILFFSGFGLFNYYLFQYSHFTMAEVISAFSIFISIIHLSKFYINKQFSSFLYSFIFCLMSILFKIQSIYFIPLFVFLFIYTFVSKKLTISLLLKCTVIGLIVFIIGYYLWYLPHVSFYEMLYNDQISNPFINPIKQYYFIYEQIKNYFFNINGLPIFISLLVSFVLFIFNMSKIKKNNFMFIFNLFLFFWLIIESHKLFITYVPPRYLVSLVFSISVFSALQFSIYIKDHNNKYKNIIFFIFLVIFTLNIIPVYKIFIDRKYTIYEVNTFFKKQTISDRPILGQWANSLAINSDFRALSFTYNSYIDSNFLRKSNPKYLIVEKNETDFHFLENANYFQNQILHTDSLQIARYFIYIHQLK